MAYTIIVEWPHQSRLPSPLRCRCLGTARWITSMRRFRRLARTSSRVNFFEDDGHWGKAGRLTFARCEVEPTEETTARLHALLDNSHSILITTIE
jgi:hypothetical protein